MTWQSGDEQQDTKYEMRETKQEVIIYIDGASRGNPGPAAAAAILTDGAGAKLHAQASFLGQTTNNVAEYTAIIKALEAAKQIGAKELVIFSDSELLVKQVNGQYRVKSERIRPLFRQAVNLLGQFEGWKVQHIAREKNKEADKLVNRALDLEQDFVETQDTGRGTGDTKGKKPIRLGVLISGGGTTLINILKYIKQGRLNAEVAVVISSRSNVAGVEKARKAGLDVKIIRKKDYLDIDEFSKRIEEELVAANVDLVIQAGWLCLWKIPARWQGLAAPEDSARMAEPPRVMNIHPALLPSFGGQGMWGHHVHEAVLAAGCKVSGCTVHFCTNEYDKGPILVQRCCQVKEADTPETLAARVFEQECIAYPQAIRLFAEGKLRLEDGKVSILDTGRLILDEDRGSRIEDRE